MTTKTIPQLVKRVQVEEEINGSSYEERNWAKLSPIFREAHNRLRQAKGLSAIPPPKVDLYVPPKLRTDVPKYDFNSPEFRQTVREFLGPTLPGGPEGFTVNGESGDQFLKQKG